MEILVVDLSNGTMNTPISSTVRVRFAPAPTGYLHLGGARTALFNWLYARHHGGKFILRIEDTDLERNLQEASEQVIAALKWLGLDWDEGPEIGGECGPYFQSQRRQIHLEFARKLLDAGLAYECYMSLEELEAHRKVAVAAGKPFHYEGWHRELTRDQIAGFKSEGRKAAIRLRVDPPKEGYIVRDLIKGDTHFPPDQIDDFILVRSDGVPSFHLANVVDDATMTITHVIRGEDHLTNTIRHLVLFEKLGFPAPQYAHLPMILGPDRSKLSKRHGAVSVMEYEKFGYLPHAMINELALLGWSPADGKEELSRDELIARFDLDRCGRSGSIFDFAKLDHFNRLAIKAMPLEMLEAKLQPYMEVARASSPCFHGQDAHATDLISLLRDELHKFSDFPSLVAPILNEPTWSDELLKDEAMKDARKVVEAIRAALESLPEPWDRAVIKAKIQEVGKTLGIKGKFLFMPIRAALTGSLHGPALDGVVVVLGRNACLDRILRFQK